MTEAEMAMAGREYWLYIKEKYQPDEDTGLVIVQTKEQNMTDIAFRLLPIYLKRKYLKRVIVITDQEAIAWVEQRVESDRVTLVAVRRKMLEELLIYYRLVQFFHEIVVISLEEPYGNAHIIENEGITLEDFVKNALYV